MRTGAPSSGAVTVSPQTGAHQYVAAACALLLTFAVVFAVGMRCLPLVLVLGVSFASGVVLLAFAVVLAVGMRCLPLLSVLSVSFASGIALFTSAVVLLQTHIHTN